VTLVVARILVILLLFPAAGLAQEITFPEDELPNESLTPLLDSPAAVVSRVMTFENKWDAKLSYGWLLDEPFYQNSFLSVGVSYSWSEFSAVTLRYMTWGQGLSDYSKQFAKTATSPQFGRASGPESGFSVSYDHRILYGKVSFSKNYVIPTTATILYEAGMIKYGSRQLPFAGLGLGNAWHFSRTWSVNIGTRLYLRQAMDPLSADLKEADPAPAESEFGDTMKISTVLDLGLQYFF
jgi:outer membrane beta-barrel protein